MIKKITADQAQDILFNRSENKNKIFFEDTIIKEQPQKTNKSFEKILNKFQFCEEDKEVVLEIIKDTEESNKNKVKEVINYLEIVSEDNFSIKDKNEIKKSLIAFLEEGEEENPAPAPAPAPEAAGTQSPAAPVEEPQMDENNQPEASEEELEAPKEDSEEDSEEDSNDEAPSIEDIDLESLDNTEKLSFIQNIIDSIEDEEEFAEFMDSLTNLIEEYKDSAASQEENDNSEDESGEGMEEEEEEEIEE